MNILRWLIGTHEPSPMAKEIVARLEELTRQAREETARLEADAAERAAAREERVNR